MMTTRSKIVLVSATSIYVKEGRENTDPANSNSRSNCARHAPFVYAPVGGLTMLSPELKADPAATGIQRYNHWMYLSACSVSSCAVYLASWNRACTSSTSATLISSLRTHMHGMTGPVA